ncbi:sulfatase [Thalassomonas sp. M1454]|uniref:sulfatase n=1 Tax=Thalassomonas sp. M1454 TaxID=2594477 RepID=UPI00117C935D|nr:sulfatase [Thalassomonas sp. M1454]TRX54917.1 sulfatase [Thalassomonas sp. M1454]
MLKSNFLNLATKLIAISVVFFSCFSAVALEQESKKLNFLVFLVDDLGKMDLGIEGSNFYETPHIDKLATKSMRFTNGYAAAPVCSPSRASILLGTYPVRHGITDYLGVKTGTNWKRNTKLLPPSISSGLPKNDISIAEAMQQGGYKTFFAGKWHLGKKGSLPEDSGFDINIGGHHRGSPPGGYYSPYKNPKMKNGKLGESLTLRLAQETADFIEQNKTQPFFAYLSFYAVHGPIQSTEPLWKKYQNKAVKQGLHEKRFKFDRTKSVRQVQDNPIYAGMMETLDNAVGLVLNKLKETGQDKNTVIIFTSDNGGVSSGDAFATSSLPYRGGKGRQWEGGIREPFYIYTPQLTKKNQLSDVPVIATDIYPTILDLAKLPLLPNQHKDGLSLLPLLNNQKSLGKLNERNLFWHYPHYGNQGGEPSSIIRSGNWKLIHYYEDGRDELYNLEQDISEQNDLVAIQTEKAQELRMLLDGWLKETGALTPVINPNFDAEKHAKELHQAETSKMKWLESKHAKYLKADYIPNKTWWDSKIPKD